MLAIILAEDDAFYRSVSHRTRLLKYEVLRYRDPVKLIDNLEELRPQAVIVHETDFPGHWEILAATVCCSDSLKGTRILVVSGKAGSSSVECGALTWIEAERDADTGRLVGRVLTRTSK